MTRGIVVDPATQEENLGSQSGQPDPTDQNANQDDLPEKFRGKSTAEIIEMYSNLESELGRVRNEIGETRAEARTWRSLAEELGTVRRQEQESKRQPVEISSDELIAKPKDAIRAVLDEVLEEKLGPVVKDVQKTRRETEADKFARDFPNYVQTGNDPEFQSWVTKSPRRLALVQRALESEDIAAMRELMEGWEERQALIAELRPQQQNDTDDGKAQDVPTGVQGARKVATEKSGQGGNSAVGKKVFYESDVVNTLLRNPDKYYSAAYQEELLAAMREGRYKK